MAGASATTTTATAAAAAGVRLVDIGFVDKPRAPHELAATTPYGASGTVVAGNSTEPPPDGTSGTTGSGAGAGVTGTGWDATGGAASDGAV